MNAVQYGDETEPGGALSSGQIATMIALGAALWFLAAMILKVVGPMGAHEGFARILLYGLIVPGSVPFVFLMARLGRLQGIQLPLGVAVADATALMLDGVAVAWLPGLYGDNAAHALGAATAILWGAGVILALAFIMVPWVSAPQKEPIG
ncbi:MAG: hypothetical protein AAF253_12380 [Pseudomonadota bacterium]